MIAVAMTKVLDHASGNSGKPFVVMVDTTAWSSTARATSSITMVNV
jgi:hypothetical protein